MNKSIAIFGTSGAALEIADICFALGYETIVLLEKTAVKKFKINNLDVLTEDQISDLVKQRFNFAIGISDPERRERVTREHPDLKFPNLIHPRSSFGINQLESLHVKRGNVVAAGAAFMSNTQMGNFGFFSLNCTIGHDCIIADFVSVMPGANVSGNVRIAKKAFIGSGCVVLQGSNEQKLVIGEGAIIGAGAVVTKSVATNRTVVGVPAREVDS